MANDSNAAGSEPQDNTNGNEGGTLLSGDGSGANQDQGQDEGGTGNDSQGSDGAPDSYETFNVPEGVKLDDGVVGDFTGLAKELNLSQGNAQKLIDIAVKNSEVLAKAQTDQWDTTVKGWENEIKADSEFGGAKLDETLTRAKRTLDRFGNDDFKSFLDQSGFGNNPHLIRMFAKLDKAVGEDKTIDGSNPGAERSRADILYGKK